MPSSPPSGAGTGRGNSGGSSNRTQRAKSTSTSDQQAQQQQQQGPTVLTFALKHRPRATRASVPKVRTGCKTCKRRHVKCDEAKPSCTRCLKWKGVCEGYDAPAPTAETNTYDTETALEIVAQHAASEDSTPNQDDASSSCRRPSSKTQRASSTSSSSAVTHSSISRRTTPSSDVSNQPPITEDVEQVTCLPPTEVKQEAEPPSAGSGGMNASRLWTTLVRRAPIAPKREYEEDDTANHHGDASQSAFRLAHFSTPLPPFAASSSAFPLEPNYNSVMFASQWEKVYFDSWLSLAPNLGGGWFPSRLWTSTIPQLCRDEPAVRFAAIAVGAMTQAMSPALLGRSYMHMVGGDGSGGADGAVAPAPSPTSDAEAAAAVSHYRNALTYYGHALRLLRLGSNPDMFSGGASPTAADNNSDAERAAVLSCLLFVCFEALQGNREGALHHIKSGLQIVDQFVARNMPGFDDGKDRIVVEDADQSGSVDAYERQRRLQRQRQRQYQLLRQASDIKSKTEDRHSDALSRVLTRSPAPYVLEDEVMQVFRRLDFQAWSLGVFRLRRTRPADIRFQALDALNPATIPQRFDTLDDARRWWDLVQHWVLQFPRYMVSTLQQYIDAHPEAAAAQAANGRMLDICDVPGAREIRRDYLQCLARWSAAFWPLLDTARRRKNDSGINSETVYLKAASLQIQYLLAWIGVRSLVYSDYEAMYQLTPQFRELNRLAALILPKQPRYTWSPFGGITAATSPASPPSAFTSGELFTMDNGPTMAIFIVSCKCRVAEVRNESIRLLAAYPRRDGFWDSKILWAIADWNRVIEAENETEGSLYDQWLRLRQREAIFDEGKPEVHMTAWVKNKETGEFEKLTQTVRWDH